MAKTVFKGRGSVISGVCPRCPERVSVFLRENEAYKNSRCMYCGAEIYGDGISGMIREGHHVSLISRKEIIRESSVCPPEILEYDKKLQEDLLDKSGHRITFSVPHRIRRMAKKSVSSQVQD